MERLRVNAGDMVREEGNYRRSTHPSRTYRHYVLPVNVEIPGCPPAPIALLQGILAAISVSVPESAPP